VSLGQASEFTSKVTARLRAWHACGRLLPSLARLSSSAGASGRHSPTWPSQRDSKSSRPPLCSGLPVHFLVPVPGPLHGLTNCPEHELVGDFATAARCLVAALCRPHGTWRNCRLSVIFGDGSAMSLSGAFVERLRRKGLAVTEFRLLGRLRDAAKAALRRFAEDPTAVWPRNARLGSSPIVVQHHLKLAYNPAGSVLLRLPSPHRAEIFSPVAPAPPVKPPPALLAAAVPVARAAGGGAVVVDFAGAEVEALFAANGPESSAPAADVAARLRGVQPACLPAAISALQSGLLGEAPGGQMVLETLLLPVDT